MLTSVVLWLLGNNTPQYAIYILITLSSFVVINSYWINVINHQYLLFNELFIYDGVTITVFIISGFIALWLLASYSELTKTNNLSNEWVSLIILLMISLTQLTVSNSQLSLLVTVELQSLVLYILLSSQITTDRSLSPRRGDQSGKMGLSYLINAAAATGFLVFGIGTNSTLLIIVSLIWKLGIIPVHVWSLPILDNLHSITAAVYLTLAKYGLIAIIGVLATVNNYFSYYLMWFGIINLIWANLFGLLHFRYQRIITYSSLIQIGYMLLALSFSSSLAITYFELYSIYTVMLLLLWSNSETIQLQGSSVIPKLQLYILVFVLYTVAGLPWMPLFWSKLAILQEISSQSLIIALVSTLLSSLIYVRLIKYITFYHL